MKRHGWFAGLAAAVSLIAGVAGAGEPVELLRDAYGVPHIYAETLAGAGFGLARAQAEDNLPGILEYFARARGEGALALGASAGSINEDFYTRALHLPEIGRTLYEQTSPKAKALIDAYAAGINLYLDEHPELRPEWFGRASGQDVVALGKWFQAQQCLGEAKKDLARTPAARRETDMASAGLSASNMWAVGPGRSSDGSTMLFSDPHLPWSGLTLWHEFQLVVGDRWVYGAGFHGLPMTGIGFNPDVAWGSTNNSPDIADAYRVKLDPDDPNRYLYEGEWQRIESETIDIPVPGGRSVRREARRTRHGLIVEENRAAGTAYAVRLAGLETVNLAELGPLYFEAKSVDEYFEAVSANNDYKWHRIAADRHGGILYFYCAATHERDDSLNWAGPVDGSTRKTEWGERIPASRMPRIANPSSGLLVNCNNNPYTVASERPLDPADFPRYLASQSLELSPSSRAARVFEILGPLERISLEDMKRAAFDIKTLTADDLRNAILDAWDKAGARASDPQGEMARAVEILRGWDGMASIDNKALPILTACLQIAGKESPPASARPQALLDGFSRALALMKDQWGSAEVDWGSVHVLRRGNQEWPCPGAGNSSAFDRFTTLFMAGARRIEDGRLEADRGSSWMMLVRYGAGGGVEADTLLPWGVSQNPESAHYADQAPLFSARRMKAARLTRAEVEAEAKDVVRLVYAP